MLYDSDKDMSTSDSIEKDTRGAIKMGNEAAKAAKTITKAASQASTGNYLGAAATVVKDSDLTKTIIIIALIPCLLLSMIAICFLYALPTIIFDTVQSFWNGVAEQWNESYYSNDDGTLRSAIYATVKVGSSVVADAAGNIWAWLKGLFTSEDGSDYGAYDLNNQELHITQSENAELETLKNKIDVCANKIETRQNLIQNAIIKKADSIARKIKNEYGSSYDYFNVYVNTTVNPASESAAIQLLSLYTVQTGASLSDVQLSTILKWLGWNGSNEGDTEFDVLGVTCEVETWHGTFLPQYLYEQQQQEMWLYGEEITNFSEYQCPLVDLVISIDYPSMAEIKTIIIESEDTYDVACTDSEGNEIKDENGETVYETVTDTYGTVYLNIQIGIRNISDIVEMTGLWKGPLSN